MYYRTCDRCGCNLDPGERCDCKDRKEDHFREVTKMIRIETGSNQYRLRLEDLYEKAVGA